MLLWKGAARNCSNEELQYMLLGKKGKLMGQNKKSSKMEFEYNPEILLLFLNENICCDPTLEPPLETVIMRSYSQTCLCGHFY